MVDGGKALHMKPEKPDGSPQTMSKKVMSHCPDRGRSTKWKRLKKFWLNRFVIYIHTDILHVALLNGKLLHCKTRCLKREV